MRIKAQLSVGRKLHLTNAAFSTDESAVFFVLCRKRAVDQVVQGKGLFKLSPKKLSPIIGESLKRVIGELKLSYRRVFSIIGESLAAVRRELRRGYLFGIF